MFKNIIHSIVDAYDKLTCNLLTTPGSRMITIFEKEKIADIKKKYISKIIPTWSSSIQSGFNVDNVRRDGYSPGGLFYKIRLNQG